MAADAELQAAIDALVDAAHEVAVAGLVPASSGNVSVRAGERIAITGGGVPLADAVPATCVVLGPDGAVVEGSVRPSSEVPLHRAVYATTDAGAIVHTHSHSAAVLSTLVADEVPVVHYATARFGGPLRVAPYARFGSAELAANVAVALDGRRGALLANHGAVVIGESPSAAAELATLLEWLCSVTYHALAAGEPRLIDVDELEQVRSEALRIRYGEAPDW